MFTVAFLKAVLERAVKAFASSLVAVLLAGPTGLLSVAWQDALSVAGMAAVVSVLLNVASGSVGPAGPSLTSEVLTPPAPDIPA